MIKRDVKYLKNCKNEIKRIYYNKKIKTKVYIFAIKPSQSYEFISLFFPRRKSNNILVFIERIINKLHIPREKKLKTRKNSANDVF